MLRVPGKTWLRCMPDGTPTLVPPSKHALCYQLESEITIPINYGQPAFEQLGLEGGLGMFPCTRDIRHAYTRRYISSYVRKAELPGAAEMP